MENAWRDVPACSHLETMGRVYPKAKEKFLMSEGGTGVLPLLDIAGGDR